MTREEKIKALIQDRLNDWVYAQNTDSLEDALYSGFVGFDNYTDKELEEAYEELELNQEN